MKIENKTFNKSHALLLIGFLSILIAAGGYFYYRYQANTIREEKHNELEAIADLKIDHLVEWRNERIADALLISRLPYFIRGVEQWFQDKTNIRVKSDLVNRFALPQGVLKKEYGYESMYLASTEGELLLSVGRKLHNFDQTTSEKIKTSVMADSLSSSDFYYCKTGKTIHYDIIAPLKNEKNITIAMLVLRVNPYDYLYPIIQSWPTRSKSSETLIIRKEGDSVLSE